MNINDLPNNSHKYKEAQNKEKNDKRFEKVVKSNVKVKGKSKVSKFADVFISEDVSNVKSYVVMDVIIPAAKKLISDIVRDGIDMILYGTSGRSKSGSSASKVSYRSYYDRKEDRPIASSTNLRNRFDQDTIGYESRGEAEKVYDLMCGAIGKYGFVTVGDMYDMSGLSAPHTAYKYGWLNISNAKIVRSRDGDYIIELPKAAPID